MYPTRGTGKEPPEISKTPATMTKGYGQSQTLSFVKRSSLWKAIESTEAFRLLPQKPHFHPLNSTNERARERHAINKMVNFVSVVEESGRLEIDHPRTEIEELLGPLSDLETYGFDVDLIRNRLVKLISFKDKQEGLESRSKEVEDNIGSHRAEVQKIDKEIESIDKQVSDLMRRRCLFSKLKEEEDSMIVGLEAESVKIQEDIYLLSWHFHELATASFV